MNNNLFWARVLSNPTIYELGQYLVGAKKLQKKFLDEYVQPWAGCSILDIGCGTGEILKLLPPVSYLGIDFNEANIRSAKRKFGNTAKFICDHIDNAFKYDLKNFDIILAVGALHHLDEDSAQSLFKIAKTAMKPKGRLYTLDNCYKEGMSRLSKFTTGIDQGNHIRHGDEYLRLGKTIFTTAKIHYVNLFKFPHSQCIIEFSNRDGFFNSNNS
ncbi:MAG TPA: class I SAM-dependent methyltransferase [Nitrospinaceae bacterium]|jgi:SAM-dependent methyltransferase|nr:class I SAM-dependent methyltransferase [Nitrospinaceae bacterium]